MAASDLKQSSSFVTTLRHVQLSTHRNRIVANKNATVFEVFLKKSFIIYSAEVN